MIIDQCEPSVATQSFSAPSSLQLGESVCSSLIIHSHCRLCSGNLYTPTPELSISTISTTISASRDPRDSSTEAESRGGGGGVGGWSWLPWARKHSASSTQNHPGLVHSQSDSLAPVVRQGRTGGGRPPHWRYSHSDAIYGFRPPPPPSSASLTNYSARLDLTNIDSLSNLLWGPPPPYSQPPSTSGETSAVSPSVLPVLNSPESISASPQRSQSRLSRTTKSGILIENTGADNSR